MNHRRQRRQNTQTSWIVYLKCESKAEFLDNRPVFSVPIYIIIFPMWLKLQSRFWLCLVCVCVYSERRQKQRFALDMTHSNGIMATRVNQQQQQ